MTQQHQCPTLCFEFLEFEAHGAAGMVDVCHEDTGCLTYTSLRLLAPLGQIIDDRVCVHLYPVSIVGRLKPDHTSDTSRFTLDACGVPNKTIIDLSGSISRVCGTPRRKCTTWIPNSGLRLCRNPGYSGLTSSQVYAGYQLFDSSNNGRRVH